jgi:hypothetical protein
MPRLPRFGRWTRQKMGEVDSCRPPVIRLLLIVHVPDASDKRSMALAPRPIDRFSLRSESGEHMVGMVFDDIIVDSASLGPALGARLNVNVRHPFSSLFG